MKRIHRQSIIYKFLAWSLGPVILASCSGKHADGKIILTLSEKDNKEISFESRYFKEKVSKIVSINAYKTLRNS